MANSVTVIPDRLPAPALCLVARRGLDRQPRDESFVRMAARISKGTGGGQELQTFGSAITSQAFASQNGSADADPRWRLLTMPGQSWFALVKVLTPAADIQSKHCPRSIRLVLAIYRFRVATMVEPLALSRCKFQRSAFRRV